MSTDYEIHRIKWDIWAPSAIKTLTYSQESNLLAIGREDGEIEVGISYADNIFLISWLLYKPISSFYPSIIYFIFIYVA